MIGGAELPVEAAGLHLEAQTLVLLLGRWGAGVYSDYLWYQSLGALEVWRAKSMATVVLGVASFASSLIAAHLVDVFRLVVDPIVLGRGLPIFAGLENPVHLKLEDLKQFDTGLVVKTYRPCYNE